MTLYDMIEILWMCLKGEHVMNEKNYWYAALENAEDDWFRGSIDLDVEERYRVWENNKIDYHKEHRIRIRSL